MTWTVFDHLVFAFLLVVFPVWGYVSFRRMAARIRAGEVAERMRLYRRILVEEWVAAAVVTVLWFALGRGAGALGLAPRSGTWVWVGYGVALALCALLVVQMRYTTRNADARAKARKALEGLSFLLPTNGTERQVFGWTSLTAGICEEIVFRGFLIAYLAAIPGVSWMWAAVLSSVVFGLSHAYQGPLGVARTGAVGLLFAGLYGWTGSLWAPIVVHAVMDWTSGNLGYRAFSDAEPPASGEPRAA